MRFKDFLKTAGRESAPVHPIQFTAVWPDGNTRECKAVLAFVSERQRQEAVRDAAKYLSEQHKEGPDPNADQVADEEGYQILQRAIRDRDQPAVPFFESIADVRDALVSRTLGILLKAYGKFLKDEFPDAITDEEFEKLKADAKKNS